MHNTVLPPPPHRTVLLTIKLVPALSFSCWPLEHSSNGRLATELSLLDELGADTQENMSILNFLIYPEHSEFPFPSGGLD